MNLRKIIIRADFYVIVNDSQTVYTAKEHSSGLVVPVARPVRVFWYWHACKFSIGFQESVVAVEDCNSGTRTYPQIAFGIL